MRASDNNECIMCVDLIFNQRRVASSKTGSFQRFQVQESLLAGVGLKVERFKMKKVVLNRKASENGGEPRSNATPTWPQEKKTHKLNPSLHDLLGTTDALPC